MNWHEPGLFPHRPARPHDAFVLSNILRRQRRRVEVAVVSPYGISHRLAAVHGEEGGIHPLKSAAAVLYEENDGGPAAVSNFPDYAGPLTETLLLGNLAGWAANTADVAGKKIKWDAKKLVATNAPKVEPLIRPTPREGWQV